MESIEKVKNRRERFVNGQREKGRKRWEVFATPEEIESMKAFLEKRRRNRKIL